MSFTNYLNKVKNEQNSGNSTDFAKLKEEKKKKYFSLKGDSEFRVIEQDGAPWVEAYFHIIRVGGQDQEVYCPKHNDGKYCPVCEKREAIRKNAFDTYGNKTDASKTDPEGTKKLMVAALKEANPFEPRKHLILKGLSRGHSADGVKFWRLKDNFNGDGPFNLLVAEAQDFEKKYEGMSITDIQNGGDFEILTLDKKKTQGEGTYKAIRKINTPQKPLADTQEKIDALLADKTTWRDVFTPISIYGIMTAEEYLQSVADGRAPFFDRNQKKWIGTDENGKQYIMERSQVAQAATQPAHKDFEAGSNEPKPSSLANSRPMTAVDDDDDLPF